MVRIRLLGFERQLARGVFETILPSGRSTQLPELAHHTAIAWLLAEDLTDFVHARRRTMRTMRPPASTATDVPLG